MVEKLSKSVKHYHSYNRKSSGTFFIAYVIMRKTFVTFDVFSYDVMKILSKYITCNCGVFIPVSNGIKIIKIDQGMREL